MKITRKTIAANVKAQREMQELVPRFRVSREEMIRKAHDELFAPFAWPGGYTVVFYDESGDVLCRDCAINHVYGYDVTDSNESRDGIEKNHRVYRAIFWEGPDEACADCGTLLESAYGEQDSDTDETA